MGLPFWFWGIMWIVSMGISGFVGSIITYITVVKEGVKALWIRRMGVNSNAVIETLDRDWESGKYVFGTKEHGKVMIKLRGFMGIKHKPLIDADDIKEIDPNHCIIGVKNLNRFLADEIRDRDELIANLKADVDKKQVLINELETQLDKQIAKAIKVGKDSLTVPIMPLRRTSSGSTTSRM